ncbi:hypothetical protein ACSOS9_00005, partial [Tsukamurella sp. MT6.1]
MCLLPAAAALLSSRVGHRDRAGERRTAPSEGVELAADATEPHGAPSRRSPGRTIRRTVRRGWTVLTDAHAWANAGRSE